MDNLQSKQAQAFLFSYNSVCVCEFRPWANCKASKFRLLVTAIAMCVQFVHGRIAEQARVRFSFQL